MTSKIVDKYLASIDASVHKEANFNITEYKEELTDKVREHYIELTNMKLNVARVINSMQLDDINNETLKTIFKNFDRVTNPLETLLSICMGAPTKGPQL